MPELEISDSSLEDSIPLQARVIIGELLTSRHGIVILGDLRDGVLQNALDGTAHPPGTAEPSRIRHRGSKLRCFLAR